jgi:hypothetical protein
MQSHLQRSLGLEVIAHAVRKGEAAGTEKR